MLSIWMIKWFVSKEVFYEYACVDFLGRISIGNFNQKSMTLVRVLYEPIAKVFLRFSSHWEKIYVCEVDWVEFLLGIPTKKGIGWV